MEFSQHKGQHKANFNSTDSCRCSSKVFTNGFQEIKRNDFTHRYGISHKMRPVLFGYNLLDLGESRNVIVVCSDGSISALIPNPAVSAGLLNEIHSWQRPIEDVIERLRLRTVPPGYTVSKWYLGKLIHHPCIDF